jgi:LuxR family maltose regulon positive regulatory protein
VSTALLTTKLYFPPTRPSLVPRPQLVERLQVGLQGPLTLISAPAGAGKTTVLSQWRLGIGSEVPTAWLSLDSADNDPTRFLQYLSAALDTLDPGLEEEVRPLLQSAEPPNGEAILTLLINRLSALEEDAVLALDDLHLIENPVIHTALTFLLEHLPARLHLVLLSRADPPLPLARLRARGQLVELRLADLRFSVEECAQFLNKVMNLDLTGEQVVALEKRTEGWIAGLQLAALSMRGREDVDGFVSAFTGSNHYIVDYLVEEVLKRQPEPLRHFLLKTSILDRLTGPLCDALTGEDNGEAVLEGLDHANLFIIPLDDEQRWFRYHHLFSELLHNRLLPMYPDMVAELHIKASAWFESNGYQDEAIHHALQAKDFERASRLVCCDSLNVIYSSSLSTLNQWLGAFPEAFLRTNPFLCIIKSHLLYMADRREEIDPYILSAEEALTSAITSGKMARDSKEYWFLTADMYSFKALSARRKNDLESAFELAQKAAQVAPVGSRSRVFALGMLYTIHEVRGDFNRAIEICREVIACARTADYPSMAMSTTQELASLLRLQGKLHQAAQVLREALDYAKAHGQAHLFYAGMLHLGLADTLYEWNILEEMESEAETGLALCRQGGKSILVAFGLETQAKLRHAQGNLSGALDSLAELDRDYPNFQGSSTTLRQRWQAEQGDLTGLVEWVNQVNLNVEEKIALGRLFQLAQAARMLYALDRCEEALQVLEKIIPYTQKEEDWDIVLRMLVLQTAVWAKRKNDSTALDCLEKALELAEPEGYVRVFLERGQPLLRLLLLFQERRGSSEFVSRLLAAFEGSRKPKPIPTPAAQVLVEPLSDRELEVLKLLAQGCPDKKIAETLVIARETVHKHLKNIYGKLGVHSRTEAIARARELNLL